jgi:hypothetical protein
MSFIHHIDKLSHLIKCYPAILKSIKVIATLAATLAPIHPLWLIATVTALPLWPPATAHSLWLIATAPVHPLGLPATAHHSLIFLIDFTSCSRIFLMRVTLTLIQNMMN